MDEIARWVEWIGVAIIVLALVVAAARPVGALRGVVGQAHSMPGGRQSIWLHRCATRITRIG